MSTQLETNLQAILDEKTTKIIPENIKEGVQIFNVEGTYKTELTEIEDYNICLGKAKEIYNGPRLPEARLNIYNQLEEPEVPHGIWVKSNTVKIENLVAEYTPATEANEWITSETNQETLTKCPISGSSEHSGTVVNNKLYYFGVDYDASTTNYQAFIEYDPVTNKYRRLADYPIKNSGTNKHTLAVIGLGDYIYIFGDAVGSSYYNRNYKYSIKDNTYTTIPNTPTQAIEPALAVYGTDIYMFCGKKASANLNKMVYKYDTLTDTFTQLANYPNNGYSYLYACTVGDNIYLFGGMSSSGNDTINRYITKYDPKADSYTTLGSYSYNSSYLSLRGYNIVPIGSDIYVVGGYDNASFFKFDTITNTLKRLPNLPVKHCFSPAGMIEMNGMVYLYVWTSYYNKLVQRMTMNTRGYEVDNALIIEQVPNSKYKTELFSTGINTLGTIKYEFDRVRPYTKANGRDITTPIYYGNGKEWILIGGVE